MSDTPATPREQIETRRKNDYFTTASRVWREWPTVLADLDWLLAELADTRDAVRHKIGILRLQPWDEVPDAEVDAAVARARELREAAKGRDAT